jgi:hypothetical protein
MIHSTHRRRRRLAGDRGVTMMDVVVSMVLMAVFMSIFTRGTVQMFGTASRNQAVSDAQTQVTSAFLRLDREIRYAAGISNPRPVGADQYVEYLVTNTGTPICTELRMNLASQQLQRRTWRQGMTPLAPSAWVPLATSVVSPSPFAYSAPDGTYNFQRLTLDLKVSIPVGDRPQVKETRVMFTALNTTISTKSASVCTEGRAVA